MWYYCHQWKDTIHLALLYLLSVQSKVSCVKLKFVCRITNLKYWARSEQITWKTLQLLNDLSVGYSSVRKLVKLDAVQFVLSNHTVSIEQSLTKVSHQIANYKCVTVWRLNSHRMEAFMAWFEGNNWKWKYDWLLKRLDGHQITHHFYRKF